MFKEAGIRSGMSFLYRDGRSIKNFGFLSTNRFNDLIHILINKDERFHHFIKYFESEANQILKDKDLYFVNSKSSTSDMNKNSNFDKITEFASSTYIKKLFIPSENNTIPQYMTK